MTKTRNYQKIKNDYLDLKNKVTLQSSDIANAKNNLIDRKNRYQQVIEKIELNSEAKKQLNNQDLLQKIENLASINETISTLEKKLKELEQNIDSLEKDSLDLKNKIAAIENDTYKLKKVITSSCIDLKSLSESSHFDEIIFFADTLLENVDTTVSFDSIFMSLNRYKEKVNSVKKLLEEEQKIMLESESFRVEFEKLSNAYKELEQDINNSQTNLKESIMAWEEDFINKINNNSHLKLQDYEKKQIFDLMNEYSRGVFEKVKNTYTNAARELIRGITLDNLKLENKKSLKEKEKVVLEEEYRILKETPDLSIPTLNEETDRMLKENGIDYIPLYKCIEFKEGISEEVKNNLESSLLDLNILNAKIIKEEDIEKISALHTEILYLTKTTKKKNNLLKYFNIKLNDSTTIKEDYIKEILQSISIDREDTICIEETGLSKIGVLNAIADKKYKQTFIGYLKRQAKKENQLQELAEKIEEISKEISMINNLLAEGNDKINTIEIESTNLPENTKIENILDKIKELNLSLTWNDLRQKELESKLAVIDSKLKSVKENIKEKCQGLYIPLNLESYTDELLYITSINETLQNLKVTHNSYLNKLEINNTLNERLEDITSNMDYLLEDKQEKGTTLKINIQNRDAINELLETKEYKMQKEKLLQVEQALIDLSKEKEQLIKEITKLETDIDYKESILNELSSTTEKKEKEEKIYEEIFLREYKLGYVYKDEIVDIDNTIKRIVKDGKERKEITLNDAINNFYSSYNHYSLELNDYSLRNITLFADSQTTDESIRQIYDSNTRVDITAMYQGIKLNIIELSKRLEFDIEENKDLINKQDRQLFEDILLNTVGEKIRNRINSSMEWVSKINNIMSKMQANSALKFKLVWKSITANSESEIDTKELVRILKMDPKLLKDSDRDKLTNHFRSKIKKAEELYQDSYISFYKIIDEILDYRTWFTFQLMYQRIGMSEKELTDKTFSKFSGGERAKSMYIPLFASVYAKLNLAKYYSLRIIALDEAFAGVDEENIREMFGILKYLDLDYIINSQVLWGDYDTIDDLSICELIRPQNSSVVTVERYRWNGLYKEIINNRKSFNEELENA